MNNGPAVSHKSVITLQQHSDKQMEVSAPQHLQWIPVSHSGPCFFISKSKWNVSQNEHVIGAELNGMKGGTGIERQDVSEEGEKV